MLVEVEDLDSSPSLPPEEEVLEVVSVAVVEDLGRWVNLSMASALVFVLKSTLANESEQVNYHNLD